MIVDKTNLGVSFFDETYGGVYRGRPVLVSGRAGSCKSILCYQFLWQAIQNGEKALLLSNISAHDAIIVAESMGISFSSAVESEQLIILEYASFIPENPSVSSNVMLPPEAFLELQEKIDSLCVRRVAFDSVLPWVEVQPVERIAEHVYSFIHAIERLNCTSLLTIPKPVSTPAFTLKSRLEEHCPVAFTLDHVKGAHRTFRVTKYLGEVRTVVSQFSFDVQPRLGIVLSSALASSVSASASAPNPVPVSPSVSVAPTAPASVPVSNPVSVATQVPPSFFSAPPPPSTPGIRIAPATLQQGQFAPASPYSGTGNPQAPAENSPAAQKTGGRPISFSSVIRFPH